MGKCRPDVRLPLTPLQPASLEKLQAALRKYELI